MTEPLTDIDSHYRKALKELEGVQTAQQLEKWRITYLGRKGVVPQWLRQVKDMPLLERRSLGQKGNVIRRKLEEEYSKKGESYHTSTAALQSSASKPGHLHPLTITIRRIQEILSSIGFQLTQGPLIESTEYNFDKLNMPPEHPARAETDTFYLKGGQVLRTSTSTVQIRGVEALHLKPPFRLFSPGRVFRAEKLDPTHSHTFHQFEGLVVEKGATIAQFKGVIEYVYSQFLGQTVMTRLRPSYFPFVEPGFEVDLACVFCQQKGCRICKYSGWIEVMGAGMVHPVVLENIHIDASAHQGYAFGGAIERLVMLKNNISDIRQLWTGDVTFISQFS